MTATSSAPPKCDAASTGRAATDWGFTSLPCQTRLGLRSFVDREGTVRFYCATPEHKANVERRFGHAEACRFCGDTAAIVDGRYVLVAFGNGSLGVVCDNCVEKADDEPDDEPEWSNAEGDPTRNGAFA
jgi:hypothetical protein